MSDEQKPAVQGERKPKGRPSESAIKKALGASADYASIDGATVVIVYPSLALYSERTSADVEALRELAPIASSEAAAFDPSKPVHANAMPIEANLPNSAGAQRVVVAFA